MTLPRCGLHDHAFILCFHDCILLAHIARPIIHITAHIPRRSRPSTQLPRPRTPIRRTRAQNLLRRVAHLNPLYQFRHCVISCRNTRVARRSAAMPASRNHEQADEITNGAIISVLDLLEMFNGPGSSVQRISPALSHEELSLTTDERGEVGADFVNVGASFGIHITDIGCPVEGRGVVAEILVDKILQDGNAECIGKVPFLRCPARFGA